MKMIRALVIDDERSARLELRRMLAGYPQITVLAEAADADAAESLIRLLRPDLIFLDIQMPGRSGFELLESLEHIPNVIFVTAYDNFAIKAFEVSALDYLLKPVRNERFDQAVNKAISNIRGEDRPAIFIRSEGIYHFIFWREVYLIESLDNYARLYYGQRNILMKTSLNSIEKNPDCARFFRAGRSTMFNLDYIQQIKEDSEGQFVELNSGDEVRLSHRQAIKFRKLIKA